MENSPKSGFPWNFTTVVTAQGYCYVKGSSSKPPSLNDGGADLFKRVTFDQVLKSVESSRER